MKLKTLNDISKEYEEGMEDKGLKEIKQEAIKWYYAEENGAIKTFILFFFSITESDLTESEGGKK